jgi:hypothetical protein
MARRVFAFLPANCTLTLLQSLSSVNICGHRTLLDGEDPGNGQIAIEVVKFEPGFGATAMPAPLLILIMMAIPSLNIAALPASERKK